MATAPHRHVMDYRPPGSPDVPEERSSTQHISVGTYLVIFAALMVLLVLTVGAAFWFNLGRFNIILALAIALVKASLVVLFFMHVRHSTPLMRIVVSAGFVFFGIMVLFTMGDFVSRDWRSTPPRSLEVGADGFAAPVPTDRAVVSPQPTGAPGQDELVPRGTVNPGR